MTRPLNIFAKILKATVFVSLAWFLHAPAAHAEMNQDQMTALTQICRNPSLSFQDATAALVSSGWKMNPRGRSKTTAMKHVAAGIHYRADRDWKAGYRQELSILPKTIGQNVLKNTNVTLVSDAALFVKKGGFTGYLMLSEDNAYNAQTGALEVRGRTCRAALQTGRVVEVLKQLGTKDNLGRFKLPRITTSADGRPYMGQGYVKTLPKSGLGFKPDVTEFVTIELRH